MTIKVLPNEVVSKIAAGEVVERPASVVKELVENALDAGATQIAVEVRDGGVELIRVVDNGDGIPPEEIELAFERHATSKLSDISDLERIVSLGFRGEALPSIAAVSEVSMVSRSRQELSGVLINLKDGAVMQKSRRGAPVGTTVTVRRLFGSLPARRKFLKSLATESGHVAELVTHYSLAFPKVRFILVLEGRTSLRTSGSGELRQAAAEVYGLEVAQAMLEVADAGQLARQVSGLVSPPSLHRAGRSYLSLFVNRRWVHSRLLAWAVEEAYHGMLPQNRHPIAIINVSLDPQDVDVNVHPTKTEVRFRQEHEVFVAVQRAVRRSLVEQSPVPKLRSVSPLPDEAGAQPQPRTLWPQGQTPAQKTAVPRIETPRLPPLRVLGQAATSYIIAEGPEGLYLIDQHAAHERILFEKFLAQRQARQVERQGLLEPLTIEVTPQQEEALKSQTESLAGYGFDLENFGLRAYLVRAVPALLPGENLAAALNEVLDCLAEADVSRREERIAISLACHSAVRAGQVLGEEEMRQLVRQLEQTNQPRTCPHGRPTMIHLSASQLDREFGRR